MDYLPEDKILKYNPDTLVAVRRLYNLDKPGQMDEAIDLLDAWVKKQAHFVRTDFPRNYLERVIILSKGSVERAKAQMEKICTLRTLLPHFFDKFDVKKYLKNSKGYVYPVIMPKLTYDHCRIFIMKYESRQFTAKIMFDIHRFNIWLAEYLKAHEYCDGVISITDLRDLNIMDFVAQLNFTDSRQLSTILLEGYGTRIKKFLVISTSKATDVLLKIFKQLISEKLRNRIHVLKGHEELHEHISKDLLPSDYGGEMKSIAVLYDEWEEVMSTEENIKYFKSISQARTNESLRTSTNYTKDLMGIAGSFRTLSFD